MLLKHGAGINTHSNEFKESALTLACYKGHLDMVNFLLQAGADQVRVIYALIRITRFSINLRILYVFFNVSRNIKRMKCILH